MTARQQFSWKPTANDDYDGTPFGAYFRAVARTPLLGHEGEVALAKKIEAGQREIGRLLQNYPIIVETVLKRLRSEQPVVKQRGRAKKDHGFYCKVPLNDTDEVGNSGGISRDEHSQPFGRENAPQMKLYAQHLQAIVDELEDFVNRIEKVESVFQELTGDLDLAPCEQDSLSKLFVTDPTAALKMSL